LLYRGLKEALDADRPDVIHVVAEPWWLLVRQVVSWLSGHPATALVVHGDDRHWWDVPAAKRLLRRSLARPALARADGYVASSELAIETAKIFARNPRLVTGIINTNPRDPSVFRPATNETEQRECRRRLGLPERGTGLGFIGRLVPEKGPLHFLDTVERAAGKRADVWAAVAGSGPLEAAVRARSGHASAMYLGPLGDPEETVGFYRSLDVLVVPSYRILGGDEMGPRVVIEGMLSGCLIVGTRSGAIPEMIDAAGLLVDERDVDALAEALVRAVSDPAVDELRSKARQRAIDLYSGERVAEMTAALWEHVIHARRSAA